MLDMFGNNPSKSWLTDVGDRQIIRTSRLSETYHQYFPEISAHIGRDALILDLGAGDSNFATVTRHRSDGQTNVIRLDISYGKVPPYDTDGCIAATAMQLPFQDQTFDAVVSSWLLPHLRQHDRMQAVEEIYRVLKPEGSAYVYPDRMSYEPYYIDQLPTGTAEEDEYRMMTIKKKLE